MHIGFITSEFPVKELGLKTAGIGAFLKNFSNALIEEGHEVTIFLYGTDKDGFIETEGIKVYFIKRKTKLLGWYFNRKYIQNSINKIVQNSGIDILEAPDWTGITALMRFDVPHLIRLHGSDTFFCHIEKRPQKFKNRLFEKLALKNADAIVGVSKFVSDETKKLFNLKNEIEVIYNGVDLDFFTPSDEDYNKNTLLYFGSLVRKKGILELAHIFNHVIEQNPKVKLIIAGKDVKDFYTKISTYNMFKDILIPEAREQIEYLGVLPYEQIKKQIKKAHVVVLPSFAEAFPMTWLESMAMAKPMVNSNIGWANEMITDGVSGYLVHPKKHKEYADKIISLIENRQKAHIMGNKARMRVVEKFDINKLVIKNIEFYNKLIK